MQLENKKLKFIFGIIFLIILVFLFYKNQNKHQFKKSEQPINITIIEDGKIIELEKISAKTVDEALKIYDKNITENDRVFPPREQKIYFNDIIKINREKIIALKIGEEKKELKTYGDFLENIFKENQIELDENDLIVPDKKTFVDKNLEAEIVKVEIKEEKETKKIPFKTIEQEDDKTSFLKKFVKTEGKEGEKEIVYQISYHNGKEIERKKKAEIITKEPVDKIIVQGTRMKLAKPVKGTATWYAYTNTLACASRDYPKGTNLKVTNLNNEKSVIVIVNDYGPAKWTGHIIDLDKVAFEKIASLGAGVISVKIERILE
jgi:rare lipoprotein A (peptidoglycan hydrolase)